MRVEPIQLKKEEIKNQKMLAFQAQKQQDFNAVAQHQAEIDHLKREY